MTYDNICIVGNFLQVETRLTWGTKGEFTVLGTQIVRVAALMEPEGVAVLRVEDAKVFMQEMR